MDMANRIDRATLKEVLDAAKQAKTKEFVLLNSTRYPQGGAPFRVRVVIDGQPYLLYPEQIVRDLLISEGLTEALPKGSSTNSPASVLVDEDEVK